MDGRFVPNISFGMPIITAVTPAITQFMSLISKATSVVGAFFSALKGNKTYSKAIEVQEDYAESLDKTANAAKDAANNVNKLDELNIISNDKSENKGLLMLCILFLQLKKYIHRQ